ncbi:cation:proton antiporter family protein [Arenibaculum sp.]|uniref:cation:proton antiporter n=1 Tax=Arenibaculum sp. TaxID=2865862 RepID=UPI002E0EDFEA|nr:cation:proton antiporter family protein [Arenibaculum sp.]
MIHASPFYEIAALLALACLVGLVGQMLRQPLLVGFMAVGILAGPDAIDLVHTTEYIELLAETGIAILLFLVGLKLDVQLVRTLGFVAVATGMGQVVFTSALGFAICLALGFDAVTAAYVAVALTFSSTIIIVKLLSDKREVDSLHGRIALGFLIVQDLVVVVAMVALSAIGLGSQASPSGLGLVEVLASGTVLAVTIIAFGRYAANPLLRRLARTPELLVTFAIGWAVILAAVADWLGLGMELGGLLAGVSLASTAYREAISSRLSSLRDFLLLFFFIGLGAGLDLDVLGEQVGPALVLSVFVLVGNPLIVLAIMGAMGYRKRTGLLAGLTVAQISEFSLVFIAMGLALGHVDDRAVGLVTLVGLVTITLSTYMIVYSHRLYALVEPLLTPFERKVPHRETRLDPSQSDQPFDVILFGLGRYGREIGRGLHARGHRVLGIDFDPEAVERWRKLGMPAAYGDAADPEYPAELPLRGAGWVVVAFPPHLGPLTQNDARLVVFRSIREAGYAGRVALTSHDARDAMELERLGVDLVLTPFRDAAYEAVDRLMEKEAAEAGEERAARRSSAGGP